jgi:hypothetical protein
MKTTTKTLALKINIEANRIAREYVAILAAGNEPGTLASAIQLQRYGIMDHINDARANMSDTIEKVRIHAHSLIKMDLRANPELAQRLIDFRAARKARDEQSARDEQRGWKPLPAMR